MKRARTYVSRRRFYLRVDVTAPIPPPTRREVLPALNDRGLAGLRAVLLAWSPRSDEAGEGFGRPIVVRISNPTVVEGGDKAGRRLIRSLSNNYQLLDSRVPHLEGVAVVVLRPLLQLLVNRRVRQRVPLLPVASRLRSRQGL